MNYLNQCLIKEDNQIVCLLKKLVDTNRQVVLYGAGHCGLETYNLMNKYHIPILAICDDNDETIGKKIGNIEISKLENVSIDDNTDIFITSGFNKKMKERLQNLGMLSHYIEIDFGRYEEDRENIIYFEKHKEEINQVFKLLSDEKSKDIYKNLIQFRISRDLRYLENCEEANQYFAEELFQLGAKERFLDLGSFTGDTIEEFLHYTKGQYQEIIAIEASTNNYKHLVNNTRMLKNIRCHNLAVGGASENRKFYVSDAKNSFISECGTEEIYVETVDNLLKAKKVTFIKLDIEGAEYEALQGAYNTIQKNRPILAISLYHKVEDLFTIPLLMSSMVSNYCYYIRHYSPTIIETVLYAVPIEKVKRK